MTRPRRARAMYFDLLAPTFAELEYLAADDSQPEAIRDAAAIRIEATL